MLTRLSSLNDINMNIYQKPAFRKKRCNSVAGSIAGIKNNANNFLPTLRRSEKKANLLESTLQEFINFRSDLIYNKIDDYRNIDASNYIYLGAASTAPYNQHGITLNENGNLMLIKGESHNLFKGLLKKYSTGFEYHSVTISAQDECVTPRFSRLFIDEHGILVGKRSEDGTLFSITLKNRPRNYGKVPDREELEVFIKPYNGRQVDNLTFKIPDDKTLSFSFEEGKLYLNAIESTNQKLDYSLCAYDLNLPLNKGTRLLSVKKTGNLLQMELARKNKKRIVYLDPLHISEKKVAARHLSHKPGQSLANRLGSDLHEKYHSGQPFTSTRIGNFSSKYIPLLLNNIDHFRIHFKAAREESYKGNLSKAVSEGLKSLDPGVEAILTTSSHLRKDGKIHRCYPDDSSAAVFAKNCAETNSNKKQLGQLVAVATGQPDPDKEQLAASLLQMVDKIAPDDALTISFNNSLSFFSGIAAGGIPFNPGWFAGIVGSIMSSHNLMLSPTQEGDIRFSFANKRANSLIPLAGTGQGLERTLLAGGGINYMTVMPLEANMILIANSTNSDSFSFALKKENAQELLDSMLTNKAPGSIQSQVIAEAEVKKQAEKSFVFKVECKAEGRLQVGRMVNNTFVVFPRSALGVNLSANLLQMNARKEKTIKADEIKAEVKVKVIRAANVEAELFNENTVMPIPMHGNDPLLCFPLPLQQEKNAVIRTSPSLFHKEKSEATLFEGNSGVKAAEKFVVAKTLPDTLIRQKSLQDVANLAVIYSAHKDNKTRLKELAGAEDYLFSFRQDIKETVQLLQQQERQNMGKEVFIHALAHYELVESDRLLRESLEEKERLLNGLPNDRVAKNQLKQDLAALKKHARYRLRDIMLYRNSQLTKKASLALAIINFTRQNQILLRQNLGKISFCYDDAEGIVPTGITHHAAFIQ